MYIPGFGFRVRWFIIGFRERHIIDGKPIQAWSCASWSALSIFTRLVLPLSPCSVRTSDPSCTGPVPSLSTEFTERLVQVLFSLRSCGPYPYLYTDQTKLTKYLQPSARLSEWPRFLFRRAGCCRAWRPHF